MELSGTVVKVFEENEVNGSKERIIRIKSFVKDQILDVYTYNRESFLCGFLYPNEFVSFSIVLRGVQFYSKQETFIVASKLLFPVIKPTKNHPFTDVEYVRAEVKPGK